ncbi:hypothetical protein D3C76_1788020 [compost metagenome]
MFSAILSPHEYQYVISTGLFAVPFELPEAAALSVEPAELESPQPAKASASVPANKSEPNFFMDKPSYE